MIEDLTMLSNLPVVDTEADAKAKAKAEADKAAAAETMPPAKSPSPGPAPDTDAARVARRGQDPPDQEKGGEEDS